MNARTMPVNWHPALVANYSVEVRPRDSRSGTRLFDIAPAGWTDSYDAYADEYRMIGPDDRVIAAYTR